MYFQDTLQDQVQQMTLNSQLSPKEDLLLIIGRWTDFPGAQEQVSIQGQFYKSL